VTIGEMIAQAVIKLGENISIRRFVRFQGRRSQRRRSRAGNGARTRACVKNKTSDNCLTEHPV